MMIYRFIHRGVRYAVGTDMEGMRAWVVYPSSPSDAEPIEGIVRSSGGRNTFVLARAAAHTAIDAWINSNHQPTGEGEEKVEPGTAKKLTFWGGR